MIATRVNKKSREINQNKLKLINEKTHTNLDEHYSIQENDDNKNSSNNNNNNSESCVLRVFLENQTIKSFKYDKNTCVRDVLVCLRDKLNIKFIEYFGLVVKLNNENFVSKFIHYIIYII